MLLNKYKIPLIIIVALLVTSALSFAISYRVTTANSTAAAQVKTTKLGSKQNPHEVELTKTNKDAVDLLINVGDYVQFNSKDGGEHQIIQGKPTVEHGHDELSDATHGEEHGTSSSPLDSGIFKADEGYSLQFKNVGKYEFHDNFNHDYAITVIVYDKDKKLEDTKIE